MSFFGLGLPSPNCYCSPHILSWLLLKLFGRGLPCSNSMSIPLISKLHLRFFGLHGTGLPCPNHSFSWLVLFLWLRNILAGGSLVQIPMLQGSHSENFLLPTPPPHQCSKSGMAPPPSRKDMISSLLDHMSFFSLFVPTPAFALFSVAAPLHPSCAQYANNHWH